MICLPTNGSTFDSNAERMCAKETIQKIQQINNDIHFLRFGAQNVWFSNLCSHIRWKWKRYFRCQYQITHSLSAKHKAISSALCTLIVFILNLYSPHLSDLIKSNSDHSTLSCRLSVRCWRNVFASCHHSLVVCEKIAKFFFHRICTLSSKFKIQMKSDLTGIWLNLENWTNIVRL